MERARDLSGVSFIRPLIPSMRALSPRPKYLPKALPPNTITLGVKISTYKFGKENDSNRPEQKWTSISFACNRKRGTKVWAAMRKWAGIYARKMRGSPKRKTFFFNSVKDEARLLAEYTFWMEMVANWGRSQRFQEAPKI